MMSSGQIAPRRVRNWPVYTMGLYSAPRIADCLVHNRRSSNAVPMQFCRRRGHRQHPWGIGTYLASVLAVTAQLYTCHP
jgi:hypothetical protein